MWKPRPGKWLLWAGPMVVLTVLPAYLFNTGPLNKAISSRSLDQLAAIGADWAKPIFDGRDVTLGGDAPSQEAIDKAVKAVAGTYGVRTVTTGARVVALPPVALIAPTIVSIIANNSSPEIKGTWQEGVAKTLAVTLAGKVFKYGTDLELTSNAGAWVLKPSTPLADGNYDVTAEVSDGVNPAVGTTTPAKLVVDTAAPAAPVITPVASGIQWPFTLNGTWAEDGATVLVARLAEQTWTLGKDEDLKSDGKGSWSFAPVVDLRPGTYDVTLETSDLAGNISKATLAAAIVIPEQATSTAAAIPAPIAAVMAAPTLKSATIMEARPTLAGTWPEGVATALSVSLAGRTYVLGTDAALSSDGAGNWKLKSESVLKDGTYDVVVETTNAAGKRLAITSTISVDAAAPASPTISLYAGDATPSAIGGTWAEGDAASLKVSVPKAGLEAALDDSSGALVSDGKGNWSFAISKIFESGSYDVIVETADKVGRKSFDQTKFELNIKVPAAAPAPAPATMTEQTIPTIAVFSGDQSPCSITGTWDESHAKSLKISIPGADLSASLGTDAALSSAQGAWTLALSQGLSPGIYNVIAESTDSAGKTVADQTTAEIYIKTPPPPPLPPPPPPYDCAGVLAKISAIFPLRFEFNGTQLKPPIDVAVNQYAALLKDPRCATVQAEIAGHSDFFGPRLYNQALSEWRAQTVVNALVAAGVDASRLSTKGFSESVPVDSEKSIAARKKNRRVEITLIK